MADNTKQPQVQAAKYKYLRKDHPGFGKEFTLTVTEDGKHIMKNDDHTWTGTAAQVRQEFDKV